MLLAYSARNRSASCRIPVMASAKAKRVEVRFPDPAANPYLAYAAMLNRRINEVVAEQARPDLPRRDRGPSAVQQPLAGRDVTAERLTLAGSRRSPEAQQICQR